MTVTTDVEVLTRLVNPAGRDVVDVGCGSGWLTRELAARGAAVTALEISEDQLAAAREADDGAGARYAVGRGEALPLPDGAADIVVFMRSLHHVEPALMMTALTEAARVLRPGGTVYLSEPLPEGDFFELVSMIEDETGVREAARDAIADAGAAGLRPVGSERYETGSTLQDVASFRRRMVSVDPERASAFDARRAELHAAFARLGEPADGDAGGRFFRLALRADVLRRPA